MKQYRCRKCGYEWDAQIESVPKACPRCKSYYWQEPRKRKGKHAIMT